MKRILIFVLLIFVSVATSASPQDEPAEHHYRSIPAIKMNPVAGRTALLVGTVAAVFAAPEGEESFYYLRDESGDSIRIVTNGKPPSSGLTVRVAGRLAFVREPEREIILMEQAWDEPNEEQLLPDDEFEPGTSPEGETHSGPEDEANEDEEGWFNPLLVAAVALIAAVGLGVVAFYVYRWLTAEPEALPEEGAEEAEESLEELLAIGEEGEVAEGEQPEEGEEAVGLTSEEEEALDSGEESLEEAGEEPTEQEEEESSEEPLPEAEEPEEAPIELNEVSGALVRTNYPSPEDEFFYPGRLEVVGGETELSELLFRLPKGLPEAVFTYDNRDLNNAGHFFIDHESVAEKQAKIVLEADSYVLINLAGDNPTTHNGREMERAERVELNDGDKIGIGILQVVFKSGSAEVQAAPEDEGGAEEPAGDQAADEGGAVPEQAEEEPAAGEGEAFAKAPPEEPAQADEEPLPSETADELPGAPPAASEAESEDEDEIIPEEAPVEEAATGAEAPPEAAEDKKSVDAAAEDEIEAALEGLTEADAAAPDASAEDKAPTDDAAPPDDTKQEKEAE